MALKIRRGTEAQRQLLAGADTPVPGELLYVTDTKKLYIGDGTTPGGNPISLEGFQSNTIALNFGITGNASVNAQFGVERGNDPDVFIRWNESLDRWEFTNNGVTYDAIGSFAGKTTDILPEGTVNLYYTNNRANAAFALNSINSLRDVNTTAANAGQSLIYDAQTDNWIPGTPPVPTTLTLTGAYSARRYSFTANANQTNYTLSLEPTSVNNLIVIVNGQFLAPSAYSLTGLVLTLSAAPTTGQTVAVIDLSSGTQLGAINRTVHSFLSNQGQTFYPVPGGYENGRIDVFVNGVLLSDNEIVANNGSSITFLDSLDQNDEVKVIKYSVFNSNYLNYVIRKELFQANANQSTFAVNGGYRPGFTDVYINGIKQIAGEDYIANDAQNIILYEAADAGDYIEVASWITNSEFISANGNIVIATTNDLGEGTNNLYFTTARARNSISASGSLTYDPITGTISYSTPGLSTIANVSNVLSVPISVSAVQDSTSSTTGAVTIAGGLGVAKNASFGGNIYQGNATNRSSEYMAWNVTTNATPTELFLNGVTNSRIPITTNSTMIVEAFVTARRTDVVGESAAYKFNLALKDVNGTASIIGSGIEIIIGEDDPTWSVNVIAQDSDNTVRVVVTGTATKLISWTALVKTVETIY